MSATSGRSSSKQAPLIRRRRSAARVKLVGRAIGFLQLAEDLIEGAAQLSDGPVPALTSAQSSVAAALRSLGAQPAETTHERGGEGR